MARRSVSDVGGFADGLDDDPPPRRSRAREDDYGQRPRPRDEYQERPRRSLRDDDDPFADPDEFSAPRNRRQPSQPQRREDLDSSRTGRIAEPAGTYPDDDLQSIDIESIKRQPAKKGLTLPSVPRKFVLGAVAAVVVLIVLVVGVGVLGGDEESPESPAPIEAAPSEEPAAEGATPEPSVDIDLGSMSKGELHQLAADVIEELASR
ncbi:hypothetical protein [Nesterenkonia rhizosphaerae]|uniref:Uncharacterized protein n=1 Tax=Nesterenkonia rhizosphaerae TaxID=1348272 RepID=A0ABP9G098_9MICC